MPIPGEDRFWRQAVDLAVRFAVLRCPFWGGLKVGLMTPMGRFADGPEFTAGEYIESQISVASESDRASSMSTPR